MLTQGHSDGGKRLGEFLEWCMEAGVRMATAFAFSTENWNRDAHEVQGPTFHVPLASLAGTLSALVGFLSSAHNYRAGEQSRYNGAFPPYCDFTVSAKIVVGKN